MALQTITSDRRDLHVSIYVPDYMAYINVDANAEQTIGETNFGQWLDLDRILVQLWESRSIRIRVIRTSLRSEKHGMRDCIGHLLPEMMRRGMIDLV